MNRFRWTDAGQRAGGCVCPRDERLAERGACAGSGGPLSFPRAARVEMPPARRTTVLGRRWAPGLGVDRVRCAAAGPHSPHYARPDRAGSTRACLTLRASPSGLSIEFLVPL